MRRIENPVVCPSCGRGFQPGVSWQGSNWCKARYVVDWVKASPGSSGYELSKASGFPYADVVKALEKARLLNLMRTETETREAGGFRYRYWPHDDHDERVAAFDVQLRGLEDLSLARGQAASGLPHLLGAE